MQLSSQPTNSDRWSSVNCTNIIPLTSGSMRQLEPCHPHGHMLQGQILQPNEWAAVDIFEREIDMTKNMSVVLFVVALIAVVVIVDLLFFRNQIWERLIVNIGIVLVFAAFYLRFLKHP